MFLKLTDPDGTKKLVAVDKIEFMVDFSNLPDKDFKTSLKAGSASDTAMETVEEIEAALSASGVKIITVERKDA
jgi:hypothetical protein